MNLLLVGLNCNCVSSCVRDCVLTCVILFSMFRLVFRQTCFDYLCENAVSKRNDDNKKTDLCICVSNTSLFPHSVVSVEGAAAATELVCQCPAVELAIPLRLGIQAAGYVALGNSVWWVANQARAFRK